MTDPLQPHSHDNNVQPPDADPTIRLTLLTGESISLTLDQLKTKYPQSAIPSYQYSTDHGMHGPYRLVGVALGDLVWAHIDSVAEWTEVEVISADQFGNRVFAEELAPGLKEDPILLCYESNGTLLSRQHGLVRLVVPSETDNALRQIKWVREIRIVNNR